MPDGGFSYSWLGDERFSRVARQTGRPVRDRRRNRAQKRARRTNRGR